MAAEWVLLLNKTTEKNKKERKYRQAENYAKQDGKAKEEAMKCERERRENYTKV